MDAIGIAALAKMFTRDPAKLQLFGFKSDPNYLTSRGLKVSMG